MRWAASVCIGFQDLWIPKATIRDALIHKRDVTGDRLAVQYRVMQAVLELEMMLAPHGGLKTLRVRADDYTLSVEFLGDTGNG